MFVVRAPPPDSPEASHIQNADIKELINMALHIRASYYTIVAGFVVYIWDILLTLKDEQELLWSKGGRFVKLLYLINRYLPFVGLLLVVYLNNPIRTWGLTDDICKGAFILVQICQTIEIMVATSIFVVRIHTIYSGHVIAQRILLMTLTISHVCLFVFMILVCIDLADTMFYSPTIQFCVGTPGFITGATYITPIVVESFVLFMTLLHALHFTRTRIGFNETAAGTIMKTLYVDGTQYYLIVFSLRLATTLVYYIGSESLILLMPYLEYALTSTVTSRWFLSFRRVLMETFSPHPTFSFATTRKGAITGPSITFGGVEEGLRRPSRGLDTFISDYFVKDDHDLQKGVPALDFGFDGSTDHELKTIETSSPHSKLGDLRQLNDMS